MANNIMVMGTDSTIQEYINSFNAEELTFDEFYLRDVFNHKSGRKMIVNGSDLLVKYMPELKTIRRQITLNTEEYRKYKYNPKRLSYDLYGTTELWNLILNLNELKSVSQFDLRTLYVLSTQVVDRLRRVLNLEQVFKDYNAEQISDQLHQ